MEKNKPQELSQNGLSKTPSKSIPFELESGDTEEYFRKGEGRNVVG